MSEQEADEATTTMKSIALWVGGGSAASLFFLLYAFRDPEMYFAHPGPLGRLLCVFVAAAVGYGVGHGWLRGKVQRRWHSTLTGFVVVAISLGLYIASALWIIDQRTKPIDFTLPETLLGHEQIEFSDEEREALESYFSLEMSLMNMRNQGRGGMEFSFAEYEVTADHGDFGVFVFITNANSRAAENMAAMTDADITDQFFTSNRASGQTEAFKVDGAPGRYRCGVAQSFWDESQSVCVYAYGASWILLIAETDAAITPVRAEQLFAAVLD